MPKNLSSITSAQEKALPSWRAEQLPTVIKRLEFYIAIRFLRVILYWLLLLPVNLIIYLFFRKNAYGKRDGNI